MLAFDHHHPTPRFHNRGSTHAGRRRPKLSHDRASQPLQSLNVDMVPIYLFKDLKKFHGQQRRARERLMRLEGLFFFFFFFFYASADIWYETFPRTHSLIIRSRLRSHLLTSYTRRNVTSAQVPPMADRGLIYIYNDEIEGPHQNDDDSAIACEDGDDSDGF